MYIAVDQDVLVDLEVRIIIPEEVPPLPNVYTKYITIYDNNCCKHRVPIFTVKPLDDPKEPWLGIKAPTKCFRSAAKLIRKYLDETSLSITLFDPKPTLSRSTILTTMQAQPVGIEYKFKNYVKGGLYRYTIGITAEDNYEYATYLHGLLIPRQIGYYPVITYEVYFYQGTPLNPVNVTLQHMYKLALWEYQQTFDVNTGKSTGKASTLYSTSGLVKGSFVLSPYADDFAMAIYYSIAFPKIWPEIRSLTLSYVKIV